MRADDARCLDCGTAAVPAPPDQPPEIVRSRDEGQLMVMRVIGCVLAAAAPILLLVGIFGSGPNRAFAVTWAVGVAVALYSGRNLCFGIDLRDNTISFRCVRGTLSMPIGDVLAVVNRPAGLFSPKRTHVFVTTRGSISTAMSRMQGTDAIVASLTRADPGIVIVGPDTPPLGRTASRSVARRWFAAGVVLSIGWTICGAAVYLLRGRIDTPVEIGLGAGYAAVAIVAALLAPTLLRRVVS
ncbi:MAG TPA: hypothetical protein VKV34_08550 [Thermoleophilia bacterium]|nr:hypothetical protein [Thermoleophilia bacterium]